jgi:hypothetical protein
MVMEPAAMASSRAAAIAARRTCRMLLMGGAW